MLHGIEVKQSAEPDAWVIMMNQPHSGLQWKSCVRGAEISASYRSGRSSERHGAGRCSYQMGVEVHAVTTPPSAKFKDSLKPVPVKNGSIVGYTAPFSHAENASLHAVNEILAAKGSVSFAGDEISAIEHRQRKQAPIRFSAANHRFKSVSCEGRR